MLAARMTAIGARVDVSNGTESRTRRGRVAGYATIEDQPAASFIGCSPKRGPRLVVLVTLDEGFYNEARDVYTQTIICDPSVVREVRSQGEPELAVHGFASEGGRDGHVSIIMSPLHRQGMSRIDLDPASARAWGDAIARRADQIIADQEQDAAERASLNRVAPLGDL